MKCPNCGHQLRIGKTYMTFKNDDTPNAQTEAYTNLPMICGNSRCGNFGRTDLSNPTKIVQTVTNRLNG